MRWTAQYPQGVPATIDPGLYDSVPHVLEEALRAHASKTYAICLGRAMTYAQLDQDSAALGAWLQTQNLESQARVAIMLPNIPQFSIAMAATLRAGYTCVNVNPLYTPHELEHQLNDSGASVIIILENFAHTLQAVIAKTKIRHVILTRMGDSLGGLYGSWINFAVKHLAKMVPAYALPDTSQQRLTVWNAALQAGRGRSLKPHQCTHDSLAFLQYTGGTTGLSKGAMLTHRNIISAMLQADVWMLPALSRSGDASALNHIMALPQYHIFALTLTLMVMRQGAHLTLIPNPRDIGKFVKTLSQRPFHVISGVNTLFNALMQHPEFKNLDFSHLCLSQAGGTATAAGTAQRWHQLTRCPIVEGWGMSETCAIGTDNPVTNTHFTGSIGLPFPSVEVVIKNDEEQNAGVNEPGEICIKGPNVTRGYYNQPAETANAFTADGYLRTGDIGTMDEQGYVRIVDRKKDMILVNGFNVYPNEIENVVSLCEGVLECAAIGIPDEAQGESVKLFVVKSKPELTQQDIARHCREHLTGYKQPRHIEFIESLPKTNVGKVLRRQLRPDAKK